MAYLSSPPIALYQVNIIRPYRIWRLEWNWRGKESWSEQR